MRRRAPVALALLLAACPSATPKPKPTTPVPGGILQIAVRDLISLDPAKASGAAQNVVAQLFDSLTTIDPETGKVKPGAARSWRSTKNGLRYVFTLRPARYSDGTSVVARDFVFAFNRLARKSTHSDAAFQLEQVKGFQDINVTEKSKTLSGVRATGARALEITLSKPFAELPYALAHPSLGPLPAKRYARSTRSLARAPVGNGPFRVVSARLGSRATIEKSPRYVGTKPYLDRIVFRVFRTLDDGWRDYLSSAVDVAEVPASALATADLPRANGGFTPKWGVLSFGPNLTLPKYAKPEVRRALSLAINREAISKTVYGGSTVPATGIIPAGVRGFRPGACSVCEADRDRARNIVRAAFGGKAPPIRIDHFAGGSHRRLAEAVRAGLRGVGFRNVTLRAYPRPAYESLLKRGGHDFAELGWLVDVPSPDGFLAQQLSTGSTDNFTRFKDAPFDKRIDHARATRDEAARLRDYVAAEKRALSLMPLIPVVFVLNTTAVSPRVHGLLLDGAGVFDGTPVWLA